MTPLSHSTAAEFRSPRSMLHVTPLRRAKSQIYSPWAAYVLSVLLYAILFSFWQAEPVPDYVHAAGVLVAALCLFPLALWGARGQRNLPMFELICIAYLLAFGTPLYFQTNQTIILSKPVYFSWDATFRALLLAALGMSAMLAGYYGSGRYGVLAYLPRIDLPLSAGRREAFCKVAIVSGLIVWLLQIVGFSVSGGEGIAAFIRVFLYLFNVGVVVLAYYVYSGGAPNGAWAWFLYLSVALASLIGLATGFLETALIPLILLFMVRWHVRRKFDWRWAIMGMIMFAILNPVKFAYREQTWYGGGNVESPLDKIFLWYDLTLQATSSYSGVDAWSNFEATFRQSMSRFDLLHHFVLVQEQTPDNIPFYYGKTYAYLLYGWVPRILWSDKPLAHQANKTLAVDYKIQTEEGTATTSIGIGHLPEAYANFGVPGIVIIMALQGLFFTSIDKVLNGQRSEGGRSIYLAIMVYFLNGIGSATAALFMAVIPNTVASALILRFYSKRWRDSAKVRRDQ